MIFLAYLFCGSIIGFFAGLLGIGGGIIGIPILLNLFIWQGMQEDIAIHMAIGTSLATVVVTSMTATFTHFRAGMIVVPILKKIVLGTITGCIVGVIIANFLHAFYLKKIFGLFLLLIAFKFIFERKFAAKKTFENKKNLFATTTLFGTISGMLGLGGGILIVPYLNHHGLPMRNAIATSSACIFPVAIIGTIAYMLSQNSLPNVGVLHSGYINWLAFLGISMTSNLFAPLGAKVSHRIAPLLLQKIFSVFLLVMGISMLIT